MGALSRAPFRAAKSPFNPRMASNHSPDARTIVVALLIPKTNPGFLENPSPKRDDAAISEFAVPELVDITDAFELQQSGLKLAGGRRLAYKAG
jgi:hypothetical protein